MGLTKQARISVFYRFHDPLVCILSNHAGAFCFQESVVVWYPQTQRNNCRSWKARTGICGRIGSNQEFGLEILGFVDDSLPVGAGILNGYKVLGNTRSLDSISKEYGCDEIIIAINRIGHSKLLSLINQAKTTGCTVKVISTHFGSIGEVTTTEAYTIHPTATVTRGLYSPVTFLYQRICDILLSGIALACLLPFFLVAIVLIKLTSKGKVFYLHDRIGKGGKPFKMFKFRSMYSSASRDEKREKMMLDFMKGGNGKAAKKVIDPSRVTPIGRLMRITSFDELPQLINVLKGDMSLIGPRPVLPYEHQAMRDWHHERESVLPGCTGFWQVYGRSRTSFDDMVMMDLYMIENMSPWMYVQLLLKTFPVIIFHKGGE